MDIFQNQRLNKDLSGKGDRTVFESNLAKFGIGRERVFIDTRSSQQVQPTDILNAVGPVRFFSVDGGHWLEIVQTDLRLAESSLSDHGVIALDDFHRPEWPDVSAGYFAWYASRSRLIVPFPSGSISFIYATNLGLIFMSVHSRKIRSLDVSCSTISFRMYGSQSPAVYSARTLRLASIVRILKSLRA